MKFDYFSRNGQVLPIDQATIALSSVEYSYGFGVYETIRVTHGTAHYVAQHCERLQISAQIIGLEHTFDEAMVTHAVQDLLAANKADSCNLKVLLIGGATAANATLYIQCLNPLFVDRKLYKTGVMCITKNYERAYPHAKSLNMLPSYLAYRDAQRAGAYDALLVDHNGNITEGTRTNFFTLRGKTIYTPPETDILLGVTRTNVLKVAQANGFEIIEQSIALADIASYDSAFLTSTSTKILPINAINDFSWPTLSSDLLDLMNSYKLFEAS